MTTMGRPVTELTVSRAVGHELYVIRRRRGWSRELIRELTGLSASRIDRWEKGEIAITVDALVMLAEVYQIQPTTLLRLALARIEAKAA